MTNPPLLPLIHSFLRLETLAHELYRAHLPYVPRFAKEDFREFIRIEEEHRRVFEHLYCRIANVKRHPRFPFSVFAMKCVAHVIRLGGFKAICRFECAVERRAIRDYEQALQFVKCGDVRRVIKHILHDERSHPSLETLLKQFQQDEEVHVKRMEQALRKKISTVPR